MMPLDKPPLDMEIEHGPLGTWEVHWACSTCTETGVTERRDTQAKAWTQAIMIESNHGDGRCNR